VGARAWSIRAAATRGTHNASEAETALRASEARYRGIVETQQSTVMRLDFAGRILFVNEFCCQFIGAPRDAVIGQSYLNWVHPEDRESLVKVLQGLRQPPHRTRGLSRVLLADGTVRWLEWEGTTILDEHGMPAELQSVGRDVTERLKIEEALRLSLAERRAQEERLRLLAQRQVTIREEERKRLGFDLHDGLCQEIVGIGILIEGARRHLMATSAAADLERAQRYLTTLSEHVRKLAGELRPMLLDDLGLVEGLRSLATGFSSAETRVQFVCEASVPRLEELAEVAVYRIAQEALTNAIRPNRHAHARRVGRVPATRDPRRRSRLRPRDSSRRGARHLRDGGTRAGDRRAPADHGGTWRGDDRPTGVYAGGAG